MNIFLLFVTISLACADPLTTSTGSTETSNKSEATKSQNSIPATSVNAKSSYYVPSRPTFVQLVQKPIFAHHQPIPQTMLIIAQPALIPHNVLYNQASSHHAQQLLNYFHSNPAAKYQLLYGYQPNHQQYQSSTQQHQQHQQFQQHQQPQTAPQVYYAIAQPVAVPATTHSSSNYQNYHYLPSQAYNYPQQALIAPANAQPQYQIPASTYTHQALQVQSSHHQPSQTFVPSQQITQPSHGPSSTGNNQQYTSHYYNQGPQTFTPQTPIKSIAPIITGLENFSPEQQAQIKEQLSSHFGGLTQINSNSLQANSGHGDFRINVGGGGTEEYASSSPSSSISQQTESNLKQEAREESQVGQQHYASTSYAPPSYNYRTPTYTKG